MNAATVYPAPGDRPLVSALDFEGHRYEMVTCWCGRCWLVSCEPNADNALRAAREIADEHYATHRWVNRWPSLARFVLRRP